MSGAPSRTMRRRLLVLAALVVVGMALAAWWRSGGGRPPDEDDDEFERALRVENPGYVGADACVECHAARVESFRGTRHSLACTTASGAKSPGFDAGRGRFDTQVAGLHFEMTRSGSELQLTSVSGFDRVSHRVDLVYGAGGANDEMYLAWNGDRLENHPAAWLYPLDRWGASLEQAAMRPVTPNCIECHNTWISHVPGTANTYRRDDMVIGVSCERCHGPAKEHVAHHRAHPNAAPFAVVRPTGLSRERRMDLCAQCHSNVRAKRAVFSYRPGEPLDAHYRTVVAAAPEEEPVANQDRQIRGSKCFAKSEMTCITCHDPHRASRPETASQSCATCHQPAECREQPKLPEAVRPNCVGCHMPARIRMNIRFYTSDDRYVPVSHRADHRIAVHPEARDVVLLAWHRSRKEQAEADRLASGLVTHWSFESDKHRRDGRYLAAIGAAREAVLVDPGPRSRQLLREAVARQAEYERMVRDALADPEDREGTIAKLNAVLKFKPNDAKVIGRLGSLQLLQGRTAEAAAHFERAAALDPSDHAGFVNLARIADSHGRYADAASFYAKADDIAPNSASIQRRWGECFMKLERWADAEAHLRRALEADPRDLASMESLAAVFDRSGRTDEAARMKRLAEKWAAKQEQDEP